MSAVLIAPIAVIFNRRASFQPRTLALAAGKKDRPRCARPAVGWRWVTLMFVTPSPAGRDLDCLEFNSSRAPTRRIPSYALRSRSDVEGVIGKLSEFCHRNHLFPKAI